MSQDKAMHLLVGLILSYILFKLNLKTEYIFISVLLVATFKELYDYHSYGSFDFADLVYTILGLVIFKIIL